MPKPTYKVSSNVPAPPRTNNSRSGIPETLRALAVGQSFAVDKLPILLAPCHPKNLASRLSGWIRYERRRDPSKRFVQRTQIENGTTVVRIWRVE